MKADTYSLKGVFGKDIRYLIPMFQRPYVWNRERHWEPLWEDVRTVAERHLKALEATKGDAKAADAATPPHFLGAVVVEQLAVAVADIDCRNVIDGQQRLTTLQLLLDSAQEVVRDRGRPLDSKLLRKLVLNDEDLIADATHAFKVWPTNVDREGFVAAMQDEADATRHADAPIVQAHAYFGAAVRDWAGEEPALAASRLFSLATVLQGLLRVVVIDLEPQDNAQVIFETLNARGTPLLASDLIKNFLLQRAKVEGENLDALYRETWRVFDTKKWRRDVSQGRFYRPRIDVFLNYWLIMETAEEVSSHQLFHDFRSHATTSAKRASELMMALKGHGEVFDGFDSWPWTSREGTFFYRTHVMQAQALTPLVLWLLSRGEQQLPVSERHRALAAIESWLIRRMVCGLTPKDHNNMALDLLRVAQAALPDAVGAAIEGTLEAQEADARLWPTDRAVKQAVLTRPLYRKLTRGRLRLLLEALEESLRGPKTEEAHVQRGKLTIEHVLPQNWRAKWSPPAGEDAEEAAFERDAILHSMGNLTLVNGRLNPALSDLPFDRKREALRQHSVLHLNKELIAHDGEWAEAEIRQRGERLAAMLCRTWKGPGGA